MRKVISLSALVSGLLAAPGFASPGALAAARPRAGEVADHGSLVAAESTLTEEGRAQLQAQLLEMVEKGPEDAGGMIALRRKLAGDMQEHLRGWLRKTARTRPNPKDPPVKWDAALLPVLAAPMLLQIDAPTPPAAPQPALEKAAFLGVTASRVDATLRAQLQLPRGMGLVVDFVAKDSPAQAAGLKVHDVLTRFDDQWLVNLEQLAVLVRSKKTDDVVALTIIRGGKETKLSAKLVEKEVPVIEEEGPRFWLPGGPRSDAQGDWKESGRTTVVANGDGAVTRKLVDEENEITLSRDKMGKTAVLVKDGHGKELYAGPYDSEEDRKKVPADVARKVESLAEMQGRIAIQSGGFHLNAAELEYQRTDDAHDIVLTTSTRGRSVVAKDAKSGQLLYHGPADTDEDLKKMPPDIAQKVRAMENRLGNAEEKKP